MKKFSKVIALLLALVMLLAMLAGCGSSDKPSGNSNPPAGNSQSVSENPGDEGPTQEAMTLQWNYTPPANSEDEKWHKYVNELIAEYTDGAITYELYPGGALGNEKVTLEGVVAGTINQGSISANVVATVLPEFNALCLPFMFDDVEHFFRVISSDEYYEKMNEIANSVGLQYLGEEFCAPRTLATKSPVYTPADAKGQVMRVMDGTIYTDMMAAWGFGSSVIAYGEVYTACQQGVVDGIENSNDGNLSMKFYEVVDYSTCTYHVFHGQLTFMNLDLWNSLTADTQAAFRQAWKETMDTSVQELPALYEDQFNRMTEYGVNMIVPTEEQRQEWIDASAPLYEKYRGVIGADFYDWFVDLVDSYR